MKTPSRVKIILASTLAAGGIVGLLFTNATTSSSSAGRLSNSKEFSLADFQNESRNMSGLVNDRSKSPKVRKKLLAFKTIVSQNIANKVHAKDCSELLANDKYAPSGIYRFRAEGSPEPVETACQFDTAINSVAEHSVAEASQSRSPSTFVSVHDRWGSWQVKRAGRHSSRSPASPGPNSASAASPVCQTANENSNLSLSCPSGKKIASVDFASYGTPSGSCGSFKASSCNAAKSVSAVSSACVGKGNCTVQANNGTFSDPCFGTVKKLSVQVSCK